MKCQENLVTEILKRLFVSKTSVSSLSEYYLKKLSETVNCLYMFADLEITYFENLASNQKIQIKNSTKASAVLNELDSKKTIFYFEGDQVY